METSVAAERPWRNGEAELDKFERSSENISIYQIWQMLF
jgi:hypothetical protein